MNVMPRSIAAWTRRVDSRSVFGSPRCQPPRARMDTAMPVRPKGRVGTSPEDFFIPLYSFLFGTKACACHRARNFAIAHEPLPHVAGAQVLRAQQRDAEVDAD